MQIFWTITGYITSSGGSNLRLVPLMQAESIKP